MKAGKFRDEEVPGRTFELDQMESQKKIASLDKALPLDSVSGEAERRFPRTVKWVALFVVFAIVAELVWVLGVSPFMPFSKFEVSGYSGVSADAIRVAAGVGMQASFVSTDTKAVEAALLAVPEIESAKVSKRFPDTLEIVITMRRAAGVIFAQSGGGVIPIYFDAKGNVFKVGASRNKSLSPLALPLISGIKVTNPREGMKLPSELVPFFASLADIEAKNPKLLSALSEIQVEHTEFDDYDIILYPLDKRVKVKIASLSEQTLSYALLMADVLGDTHGVSEIDFRTGMAAYTVKRSYE
jgi:cell division protein FtsQ